MRYVFTMTGAVVESDTPLSEPLFKPVDAGAAPATEAKPKAAPKRRTTAKKAAQKEA